MGPCLSIDVKCQSLTKYNAYSPKIHSFSPCSQIILLLPINKQRLSIDFSSRSKKKSVVTDLSDYPCVYISEQLKQTQMQNIFRSLSKKKGLTTPVKYVHNIFRVFTGESLSCVKITEIFLISGKGIYNELTGHTATACEEEFVQFVSLRMRALSANIRSVVTCSK